MNITRRILLLLALLSLVQHPALAGKRDYKQAKAFADETAWYVGSWEGTNTAFDPPLPVEITILATGNVYSYVHGQNKGYHVTQGDKVVKLRKLADTPMRGKMLDAETIILEDGGKLQIAETAEGLQTTVPKLGIIVQYRTLDDSAELAAIQQRVTAQQEKEAHHKDHDFWHSEAFWGVVVPGAVAGATNHDNHVEVANPKLTKGQEAALQKYYK